MYQLYYYPNTASLAPHFLLYQMGLDYDLLLVDKRAQAHKSEDYLKLNPAGRIPTLIDDGQAIFESPAICIHLCEQHPEHALIPALGARERPQFFQWLAYLNNTLQTEILVRYYPQRHTTQEGAIPSVIEAQNRLITDILDVIDRQLEGHEYLLGDNLTACDFFLFMLVGWVPDLQSVDGRYGNLAAHTRRMMQQRAVRAVFEIEGLDITKFAAWLLK